jgi:fructokinase
MDIIAHVDHEFLSRFGKQPGTMHLVEYEEVTALLKEIHSFHTMPGGSAANTARGIAWLSGNAGRALSHAILGVQDTSSAGSAVPVFNGAIGTDSTGNDFAARLEEEGVRGALVRKATPTGTSVILVTPDGERTMNTYLGACRDFQPADLDLKMLSASRMLYLTGYLWDTDNQRVTAEKAAAFCRENGKGISVAFDLADPFAVRRYGNQFRAWIPGNVDILFGNRDELAILMGSACDADCVSEASTLAPLVVMKAGAKGCLVGWKGQCKLVPGVPVRVVDTTGAGDAFAAGFLFARLAGADPLRSALLANRVASMVVGVEGCRYGP